MSDARPEVRRLLEIITVDRPLFVLDGVPGAPRNQYGTHDFVPNDPSDPTAEEAR